MGRQGSTKEKIVKLISEGSNTLSDISKELELAPSTVSKHLDDLEYSGIIQQKDNPHIKKWKYYQVVSGAPQNFVGAGWLDISKGRVAQGATALVLVVLLFSLYAYTQGSVGSTNTPIGITDPPTVPYGTQALYINYSSVSIHVSNHGSSQWVSVNSSGRLDLMGLINESQVIGDAKLPENSSVNLMRFNITSANIVINNFSYGVQLANGQVIAAVTGSVNSTSGILVDFSPVVTQEPGTNATFLMVPSLRAELVPSTDLGPVSSTPNQWNDVENNPKHELPEKYDHDFIQTNKNISVSGAALSVNGNQLSFDVILNNSGNTNVSVIGVMVNQNRDMFFIPNSTGDHGTFILNLTPGSAPWGHQREYNENNESSDNTYTAGSFQPQNGYIQQAGFGGQQLKFKLYEQNGSNLVINGSALYSMGTYLKNKSLKIRMPNGNISVLYFNQSGFGPNRPVPQLTMGYGFRVYSNGTLYPDMPLIGMMANHQSQYNLEAHSTVTLTYNGVVYRGFQGQVFAPSNQSTYQVLIVTDRGLIRSNVTLT